MRVKSILPLLMAMLASTTEPPVVVPSHKIEAKKEEQQLSKRKLQKMKGKKTRTNRGRNRK